MREIQGRPATQHPRPASLWLCVAATVLLVAGFLAGRAIYPREVVRTVVVEKEKRVEVPVERIVVKRVEVPVEVVKYVDRVVEKKVEVPVVVERVVERRVEVPVLVSTASPAKPSMDESGVVQAHSWETIVRSWALVANGMSKSEVEDLLGAPQLSRQDNQRLYWFFEYKDAVGGSVVFGGGGLFSTYRVVEVHSPSRK